ncbi:MAG: hypothetical protein ACREDR_36730, partial [Blastocatellia bacterium]
MKIRLLITLYVAVFSAGGIGLPQREAAGTNCDCTIYPYRPDPPCPEQCTVKVVLGTASKEELQLIVGLDSDTAERVTKVPNRKSLTSVESYKDALEPDEFTALTKKLD